MGLKGWGSHDSSSSGSEGKDGDASQQHVFIKNMNDKSQLFSISIDVRSFKANLHLPIASANVIVRVVLPPELVRLATSSCNASATIMTPHLTHPPIQINKGTEVIIPNGYLALELPTSAHSMATMLTQQPIVTMQIVHRDKYAIDNILGLAFVPMKQLLEHPMIEGYVPVIRKAIGLGSQLDEVKIGFLHVILAIKEMGSMKGLKTSKLKDANIHYAFDNQFAMDEQHKDEYSFNVKKFQNHTTAYKDIDSTFNDLEDGDEVGDEVLEAYLVARDNECVSKKKKKMMMKKKKPSKKPFFNMDDENIPSSLSSGDLENNNDYITHSKYELAWEFDLWRQVEESKWRANLKAQENVRMNVIEEKWKKQKKDLSIEMCNTQVEQLNLESKLRAKLLKLEKRERAIILVEEDMSKRKKSLEEDYVNQTSNAQVALKRLQTESEHRIKLECNKYVALQEQYAMLEQQLIISNASLVNLEKQFVTFRIAQQDTIEAQLVGQIITLEQHYKNLQRKGVLAIESKDDYKTQVLKMGKELANLHHQLFEALSKCKSQEHKTPKNLRVVNPPPIEYQAQTSKHEAKVKTQQLIDPMHIPQGFFECENKIGVGAISKLQESTHELHPTKLNNFQEFKENECSSFSPLLQHAPYADARSKEIIVEAQPPSPFMDVVTQSPPNVKTTTNKKEKEVLLMRIQRQGLINMVEDEKEKTTILKRIQQLEQIVDARKKDQHSIYNDQFKLQEVQANTTTKGMVTHLMQQKDDLLKTGVYNKHDRLIKGLDQKIQHFVKLGF
ncbi:unnamed protein product [Sphagnum jensenii]|uniref:Uncharacterized protein n=1 Tax=Sphagnum jensenii TaxID=128206 RepID=A0ABP0WBP6_9BRYO